MSTELIAHNPLLKQPLLNVLTLCIKKEQTPRSQIESDAASLFKGAFTLQNPATVVDILIRNEAVSEQTRVNGEPYEGTRQDIQTDNTISSDAQIEQLLTITPAGKEILEEYSGDKKLRELLAEKPHYAPVYYRMMEMCDTENGCSRALLEEELDRMPQLAPNPETGKKNIYPQYFIDSLETAGGITWRDSWYTTDEGRALAHLNTKDETC